MLKRKLGLVLAAAMAVIMFSSCLFVDNSGVNGGNSEVPAWAKDFYNYPKGKEKANGTLTLKNNAGSAVLCFIDSVDPANYIGTVNGSSEIQVTLDSDKFYNIVSVSKESYIEKKEMAKQTSVLTYYSSKQGYAVDVSANSAIGAASLIINNMSNYWASIESVTGNGERFAVVKPNAQRVVVPVAKENIDYKVVYIKELKYKGNIMGITEKTTVEENDTAAFEDGNTTFTITLNGPKEKTDKDLAPTVRFLNNTGKSVRVSYGQEQLCNFGVASDDYVLLDGYDAIFTGFKAGANATSLKIYSSAFGEVKCNVAATFENGKVYDVSVTRNTNSDPVEFIWNVTEVSADSFYTED